MTSDRLFLSPPHVTRMEREQLIAAFDSNWIAPVGPDLDAFEAELAVQCATAGVAALASGTAALHLGLLLVGVQPGDTVLVPSLTFVATANAVRYVGAEPVFVDSSATCWTLDVGLVADYLKQAKSNNTLPAAVIAVDLYGQCADYAALEPLCAQYRVPLVSDAAESLGATHHRRPAGSFGDVAALSFNGNKIITTSGGGALLSNNAELVTRARYLSTQAREPEPHYEHVDLGYNYRLSNLLAAIGRAQLQRLPLLIARRTRISKSYTSALAGRPGVGFQPVAPGNVVNNWLTVMTVDPSECGVTAEDLRVGLEQANIESRPAWKPMHMQPLYAPNQMLGGALAEHVFAQGLCLPSGSSMSDADVGRVLDVIDGMLPT